VIAPIPFGVGVAIEKSFVSKWLVNVLLRLGFSITHEEVVRLKQSAVKNIEHSATPHVALSPTILWSNEETT
jgi:hypothetical protein